MNPRDDDEDDRRLKPFPGPNAQPTQQYKFSPEELRVLRECNRESFYQRCIPAGGIMGFTTYYAVKSGFIKPNVRYGATPKVVVAVIMGYFLGKFSYQTKCAEKLMQLPNSRVGEMLRQKRRGNFKESLEPGFGPGMSLAPFSGMNSSDTYTDLNPNNTIDIDTTRPDNKGLDDRERPSVDNPISEEEMPPVQKHTTSYEELRKQNREEYQQKRIENYREPVRQMPRHTQPEPFPEPDFTPKAPKNKYGDDFE